jgi:hypothetical protein
MAFTENSARSPEQIWSWIQMSLRADMPRANYDTWVHPAQAISFVDDRFVIGCHNDYGLRWLESRLTTTIRRMIECEAGRPVQVEFVLLNQDPFTDKGDEPVPDGDPVTDHGHFSLEPVYASLRDAIMEPDRVVKMPVYFLRWLPYVGARTVFEVIGLWQEYYLSSHGKQPRGNEKVATRIERVGQWAGVSRAQLFRDLTPGEGLYWFMKKIETDHELDRTTGRSKKSANKYQLYGIPLTPGDAEDLLTFLDQQGIQQDAAGALQTALAVQPSEILQYPFRRHSDSFLKMSPHRISVQDVIRKAVGKKLDAQLADLADQLADRLLAPTDFIIIRWYFLQHWLPKLGHDAAMFILLLRNLCYFNDETGEIRDDVWVKAGYETLADRLGLDNPRQVALWLPPAFARGGQKAERSKSTNQEMARRELLQKHIACFVERLDYRSISQEGYDWHFRVQRYDPLSPEHETVKQAAFRLLSAVENARMLDDLLSLFSDLPNDCFETLKNEPMIVLRRSKLSNDCCETLAPILKDCFETLMDLPDDCFETLLKTLKGFKDSRKERDSITNPDSSKPEGCPNHQEGVGAVQQGEWNLERLLARVNAKRRQVLISQEKSAVPFLSWILYGAANPSIQDPLGLAVSKLMDQSGMNAGGAFLRLANLAPEQLIQLIRMEMSMQNPSNRDWRLAMKSIHRERMILLSDLLGIPIEEGEGMMQ